MGQKRTVSRYQTTCMGFLCILSPIVRIMPRQQVILAGDAAWLSALLAGVPVALLMLFSESSFRRAKADEGFAGLFVRALGRPLATVIIALFIAWLVFYTGFSLRLGADRYVITAYPNSSPTVFVVILLALSALPVFDSFRNLARTAQVFFPILVVVLALLFAFAVADMKIECISPARCADWPSVLRAVPPISSIMSLSLYYGFVEGQVENKKGRLPWGIIWLILAQIVIFLICFSTIGVFGATEVTRLSFPFFVMVRSIPLLNTLERLEPIVLALWVASDFIFISSLLFIINIALRHCLGYSAAETQSVRFFDLQNGRFLIWLILAAVFAVSRFIPDEAEPVSVLSEILVPYINLAFTFGLLPLTFLVGKIRKTL